MPPPDHSDSPSTAPQPELNPMMNPLLGENLGRWAEVYVTTPAEKREEAIRELLHELEAKLASPAPRSEKKEIAAAGVDTAGVREGEAKPTSQTLNQGSLQTFLTRPRLLTGAGAILLLGGGFLAWHSRHAIPAPQSPAITPSAASARMPVANHVTSSMPSIEENPKSAGDRATSKGSGDKPQYSVDGAKELAIAQGYLKPGKGNPRNPEEAIAWLWKAVARQNGAADVLLAEQYAAGDGVSKNCEQARVLLSAAAEKNVPGAAKQLQQLTAEGCP